MHIALIDKDLFASLLRYGEVILPNYSFSAISNELPIEEALRLVLRAGNPIEYPSQYIIVVYDALTPSKLMMSSIKELVATDAEGRHLFSTQFRQDMLILPERYKDIFLEYIDDVFKKENIKKGIVAFRALCGLENHNNYDEDVKLIYRGKTNRSKYRHHFQLPAEERDVPYALMIAYDRHAPYPRGWTGYFYDVIESYCYHQKPTMGYSESVIEGTGIYRLISSLPSDSTSKFIDETIKDEKFTHLCNEFYYKPGGYLTPYLFFILRDRFRESDSFSKHSKLITQMKNQFPEAFNTASIFVGGFFGYEKFYDDYYTMLNLPIFKSQIPFSQGESDITAQIGDNVLPPIEPQETVFLDGTDLFKNMYCTIDSCLNNGAERDHILAGLSLHKNDDKALEEIRGLFLSTLEKKDLFKKYLGLSRYPSKSIFKIRDYFQKIGNK